MNVLVKEKEGTSCGDSEAFESFFEAYKDHVYSVAIHLCRDPAAAEDITQNVFIKLLRRMDQFRGQSEFSTWLYRVVLNTYFDYERSRKDVVPLSSVSEKLNLSRDADQEHEALKKEQRDLVRHALGSLKPKFRFPLVLRYVAGLTYQQIASVLGASEGTVASRLNRAHLQLAQKLRHLKNYVP